MPSPSEPMLDERFSELTAQLRNGRPEAPEALRERVRELARRPLTEPPPRMPRFRRVAPLALAALVVAAVAGGVALLAPERSTRTGGADESAAVARDAATTPATGDAAGGAPETTLESRERPLGAPGGRAALPPADGRAQEYRAELSVRVRDVGDLSAATTRAMRITRSLGGYVVSARYDEPGDADGDSIVVVRVPVARVQDALMRFSDLGTILAQHISVADLQARLDRQRAAIASLRRTIERLEDELADPALDAETRTRLRLQLAEAKRDLSAREGGRSQTRRRAATARIALTLTTRERVEVEPAPDEGGVAGTLRDALAVLVAVLTWTLAGLIVASPLLVLAVLLVLAARLRRRAEERRLLERPAS